jgi:hypothetical protein
MHALITYLLSAMLAWAPPSDHDYYAQRQDTVERYESIAKDIADVAMDPNEPPLFGGPQGRAQTALFVTSIAFYESGGYRRDVDAGDGPRSRGDGGRSWCIMQINIGRGMTAEQWSGRDLVLDRHKCIRAGLARIRESFSLCHSLPLIDRLSGYTKGRCTPDEDLSHRRLRRAVQWWTAHTFDADEGEREQAMGPMPGAL